MSGSWICIDASCVVWLVAEPDDTVTRQAWDGWLADERRLVAPTLLHYEVTNALYRYQKQGTRTALAVRSALQTTIALPIQLVGDPAVHAEALDLASRYVLPAAYDAHYLAVAQRFSAEFWTTDQRLINSVRSALSWVHLVGE